MKRIILTLLIAFAGSIAFTSCTEDEVVPQKVSDISSGGIEGDHVAR